MKTWGRQLALLAIPPTITANQKPRKFTTTNNIFAHIVATKVKEVGRGGGQGDKEAEERMVERRGRGKEERGE